RVSRYHKEVFVDVQRLRAWVCFSAFVKRFLFARIWRKSVSPKGSRANASLYRDSETWGTTPLNIFRKLVLNWSDLLNSTGRSTMKMDWMWIRYRHTVKQQAVFLISREQLIFRIPRKDWNKLVISLFRQHWKVLSIKIMQTVSKRKLLERRQMVL